MGRSRRDRVHPSRSAGHPPSIAQRAEATYEGVPEPLVAEDIADCVACAATRAHHVNVDQLVVRPLARAAQYKVHRVSS